MRVGPNFSGNQVNWRITIHRIVKYIIYFIPTLPPLAS